MSDEQNDLGPLTPSEAAVDALLRRIGEDERDRPLTPEDEAMLERVKAAVLGGEP